MNGDPVLKELLEHSFILPAKSPGSEARFWCIGPISGRIINMNIKTVLLALGLALTFSVLTPSKSLAASDYEELSYQDLVDQLREKRRKVRPAVENPLDTINLHAGVGLATTLNSFSFEGRDAARGMNGFQISLGIDLFSPHWIAETALRNFGTRQSGSETQSQREIDLRVVHRSPISDSLGLRAAAGLGTRFLKFSDPARNIHVNEDSPHMILAAGIDTPLSKMVRLGGEMGFRSALVDSSVDRNSIDLMVRLDTSF